MSTEIRTIYDLLDLLRIRPGMWIGEPSITKLQHFVHGFQAGVEAAHAALEAERPGFCDFHDWIAARLGQRSSVRGWCLMLLETCGSEEAAFERFWTELDTFRIART